MANAVEAALNRMSAEQRQKAEQVIEEARRNIKLVSVRDDITPSDGEHITKQAQVIEEARRKIPFDTMKDVNEISAPLPTPNDKAGYTSKIVALHPDTQDKIESIEQGDGNNYLQENAIDRVMARQPEETQMQDERQQYLGR